jgi:hypothetical protein
MVPNADASDDGAIDSKVARLIASYGLGEAFGARLEALWTAEDERRESLRSLADRFNRRVLDAAMAEAGLSPVDGEVDNMYRLLTGDDVSSGNRTEARRRLERAGVDVDRLERDFVSYQAIRSYLTEYRDAAYEREDDSATVTDAIETIQRLESRLRAVTEKRLGRLASTDRLTIGEFRVFIDVSVLCEDCDTQYGVVELLREGSCDCDAGSE